MNDILARGLADFKAKFKTQLREERTKIENAMVKYNQGSIEGKLKEVKEEFNSSHSFLESSLKEEIAMVVSMLRYS